MRQTFMDFLIDKYGLEENKPENFYIWYSNKSISKISEYAKQWSSQQTEDELVEALAELVIYCCVAMDTINYESKTSQQSKGLIDAIKKSKAILAKHKEREK